MVRRQQYIFGANRTATMMSSQLSKQHAQDLRKLRTDQIPAWGEYMGTSFHPQLVICFQLITYGKEEIVFFKDGPVVG